MEHGRLVAIGTPEELARQLWQGVRLELELDNCDLDSLSLPPAAREVTWDPMSHLLSLWIPQRAAIPGLVDSLVSAGCCIYRVSPQEPTLEDVYFALHEQVREEVAL